MTSIGRDKTVIDPGALHLRRTEERAFDGTSSFREGRKAREPAAVLPKHRGCK
jgi:hypothetical protein